MELGDIALAHMYRRATDDEVSTLSQNVDIWREVLVRILNSAHSELHDIKEKQSADWRKYEDDLILQEASYVAWEKKRLQCAQKVRRAEYDLALLDQLRHVSLATENPTDHERFLRTAIQAHRDHAERSGEVRPFDEALYAALNGRWTFTQPPEI